MTDHELDRLADKIAERQKHVVCPFNLDADSVAFLNSLARLWRKTTSAAIVAIVGILCAAFVSALAFGVRELVLRGKLP